MLIFLTYYLNTDYWIHNPLQVFILFLFNVNQWPTKQTTYELYLKNNTWKLTHPNHSVRHQTTNSPTRSKFQQCVLLRERSVGSWVPAIKLDEHQRTLSNSKLVNTLLHKIPPQAVIPLCSKKRVVEEKPRPTPEHPPIAARAGTRSAQGAVRLKKPRPSARQLQRAAALRWLATRRIPVPWGGRARLGRPRACEWCIWKCLVAVTLAAGRYAMGWKPESSAGPRVSLDFLLHPPGPVLPGSSGGRYASGGPWRGRGGFCQWMWTELASRSAARMSVTCLSMRFEPSTGHWESRPPGRRWGSGRGALSRCGGVTGVSDWGYIWNKRVSYICSSHTPSVITRR